MERSTSITLNSRLPQGGGSELTTLAVLEYRNNELNIYVGPKTPTSTPTKTPVWPHTVFELERMALTLRFVARGHMPGRYEIPREMQTPTLPNSTLQPALWFALGSTSLADRGTMFYCRKTDRRVSECYVYLEAVGAERSAHAFFTLEETESLAEEISHLAREIDAVVDWEGEPGSG
jgi:hypothetical protein